MPYRNSGTCVYEDFYDIYKLANHLNVLEEKKGVINLDNLIHGNIIQALNE